MHGGAGQRGGVFSSRVKSLRMPGAGRGDDGEAAVWAGVDTGSPKAKGGGGSRQNDFNKSEWKTESMYAQLPSKLDMVSPL